MASPVPKAPSKFKWSAIKQWMNSMSQAVTERTPVGGHSTSVTETASGTAINSEIGNDGSTVVGDGTISLQVCIGGETKNVTFVIIGSPT
jgi:hypothetical protein